MRTLIQCICLLLVLGMTACSATTDQDNRNQSEAESIISAEQHEPFYVENWFGTWTGVRPQYPLLNANGDVITVRGKEAKVGRSTFTFTIESTGTAELTQSHDDGRIATFSGKWKGQMDPSTQELTAIVCDLNANSSGAFRRFALIPDIQLESVVCHGTTAEPPFNVVHSSH